MLSTGFASTACWRRARRAGALMAGACVLAACTTGTKAPVVDMSGPKAPEPAASGATGTVSSYVIRPGDTLYSIARAHNMTSQDPAISNGITAPSQLPVPQTLQVGSQTQAAGAATPPPPMVAQAEPIGDSGVQQRPLEGVTPAPETPAPAAPAPVANTSGIDWLWPASG